MSTTVRVFFLAIVVALTAIIILQARSAPRAETVRSETPDSVSIQKPAFDNWNCFRGPQHGLAPTNDAPIDWDGKSGKGVLWKTPLQSPGVSSPVLWGAQVFITENLEDERAMLAFDANTGKQLWRQTVADGAGKDDPPPMVSDAGLALPTPVCDSEGVYALFGTGDLAAFAHDGTPKWKLFLKRPIIGYGFSSSPCVIGNLICVQIDDHTGGKITAIENSTGKIKWEVERSRGASWSSLMVVPGPGGKDNLVVNANGSVTGYDADGKVAWDVDGPTGEVTPSSAYWDGKLYPVHNGSSLYCFKLSSENPDKVWEHRGTLCDVSSPVVANGLLFMATGSGDLVCVDAETGKEIWKHRSPGCYASLAASGERIYCPGRDGTMLIVAAERTFRTIATCRLGEGFDATPAFGAKRIYIRARKNLWCVGEK